MYPHPRRPANSRQLTRKQVSEMDEPTFRLFVCVALSVMNGVLASIAVSAHRAMKHYLSKGA